MSHFGNLIVDAVRYPSVTEILAAKPKPWLERWRLKWGALAEKKTRAACDIGDDFDAGITQKINGIEPKFKYARCVRMYKAFLQQFLKPYHFEAEVVQTHVISYIQHFHGTLDAVGYVHGKKELCLFDWKTSSAIYPDYDLQLAGYAIAYEEQTGIKIKTGYIVQVSKDKPHHKVTIRKVTLGSRLRKQFLKRLAQYWKRLNEC